MNGPNRQDLELFAAAVVSQLGFSVDDYNADQVWAVLQTRLEGTLCKTVEGYIGRFNDPNFAREELREVALALTVGETYFFRHPEQLQALAELVLPACLRAREPSRQLNVLSAGCASGEEAYSLVATALQVPGVENWDLRVRGVDINTHLLRKARQARYPAWSLRTLGPSERALYFDQKGSEYLVNENLKSRVTFEERNLLDSDNSSWPANFFDIIFCRNVIIYFAPTAVRTLIARLTRSLAPGGFLFLGPSEILRGISQDFHLRHTHGAFYYQCKVPGEQPALAVPSLPTTQPREGFPPTQTQAEPSWVSAIAEANQRLAGLADIMPSGSRNAAETKAAEPATGALFPPGPEMDKIRDLLRQERFGDALSALDALPPDVAVDPDALMMQVVLLANRGELARAEQLCARLLENDELRPGAHYLMAICQERRGDYGSAAEHDRTAIYLDGAFAMPHLHLGLLSRRLSDLPTARQELAEAIALLAREHASRILLFGGGFSREALIRFCQAQLERCGGGK